MGKILVAEDSLIVNQHISHALKNGNHEVISAYTGKEAVHLAQTEHPDLILMDIMMETQTDGIDAALELKGSVDIPIIFLTALTDEPTIQKVKISLPYGYIVKPFNEAELLSNIDVALYKADAEKKIKENSDLFQAIINSIDEAIFLIDEDQKIKYTNIIAEKILQKPFNLLIDRPVADLLTFEGNPKKVLEEIFTKNKDQLVKARLVGRPEYYGDFYTQSVSLDQEYRLLIFKDVSKREAIEKENDEMKKRKLSSFIEGQEKERERVARDLHDGVGQIANMIKLSVQNDGDRDELVEMVQTFIDEMRKVTEGLLPARIVDFPLDVNIKKLVEDFKKTSRINFSFSSDDLPEIELKHKINLYRIIQENMTNIVKHSDAQNATIQLYHFDGHLQLTVEDDGKGFESGVFQDDESHHGLQNMAFRSEVLGGQMELESTVGSGTFFTLKVPLNE